jgi:hypothetical protein
VPRRPLSISGLLVRWLPRADRSDGPDGLSKVGADTEVDGWEDEALSMSDCFEHVCTSLALVGGPNWTLKTSRQDFEQKATPRTQAGCAKDVYIRR